MTRPDHATAFPEWTTAFIDGHWMAPSGANQRAVLDPSTEETVARVEESTADDVDAALDAARRAQRAWGLLPPVERARHMLHIADQIRASHEDLARLVTLEQGKTIGEARGEIDGTVGLFTFFAEFALRLEGEILPSDRPDEHVFITRVPHGVVAGIAAWNYPSVLPARKIAPALIAGNTIVIKPHEDTPLSALALAGLIERAGLPAGVVNVVLGAGETVGEQLVADPRADLISMTGSTEVGKRILAVAAERVAPVSLELGGKAPFIVLADADLDLAVRSAVGSRFTNCGQVCICNERTFVHASRYDEFVDRYVKAVRDLRVGDPFDAATDMGPKVSAAELEKVDAMVQRARGDGATVLVGGGRLDGAGYERGYWYAPTVLADVTSEMEIAQREIFGPVSPVLRFDDLEAVVEEANRSTYGLSAYLFTRDLSTAFRTARDLQYGELFINRFGPEQVQGYHTGFRQSGMGGDDGKHGLEGYLRKQTIYLNYAPVN